MFALGYALQRGVLNRTLGESILPPLLVTFGMSIVIQNALLEIFGADTHRLVVGSLETASIALPGGLYARGLSAGDLPGRRRRDRGLAAPVLPHRPRPRLPRHLGRRGDGRADGRRQPASLQPRHGDRDDSHRHRRRLSRRAHEFRSFDRAVAPDLCLRGDHHRRPRQYVGHARWRGHSRHRPVDRRRDQARFADPGRPCRVPDRARRFGRTASSRGRGTEMAPPPATTAADAAFRVERGTRASRVFMAQRRGRARRAGDLAVSGRTAARRASSPRWRTTWRLRSSGTCSPAMPDWSRSASRPSSASAAMRCSCCAAPTASILMSASWPRACSRRSCRCPSRSSCSACAARILPSAPGSWPRRASSPYRSSTRSAPARAIA